MFRYLALCCALQFVSGLSLSGTLSTSIKSLTNLIPDGIVSKRVIVDVDPGTDDYEALVALIHADNIGLIKIEAICVTDGNTLLTHGIENTLRLLETAGRTDIPVHRGANNTGMISDHYFGIDGFGDHPFTVKQSRTPLTIRSEISIDAMYRLVRTYPGEITIIAIGPLTNVANAMMYYDDFVDYVKDYWVMGGNHNSTRPEFNWQKDAKAAQVFLNLIKTPVNLLTWEGSLSALVPYSWFDSINLSNPVWNLLKLAEARFNNEPRDWAFLRCDPILAIAFLYPEEMIVNTIEMSAYVISHGTDDVLGLMVPDPDSTRINVRVIDVFNIEAFKTYFYESMKHVCDTKPCAQTY